MKIELRNLVHHKRLSEETNAFSADLWIDDVKVGTAENTGKGAPTSYHVRDRELLERFEAHCKSLPGVKYGDTELPMNAEFYLDTLVEEDLARDALRKACRKQTLFRLKDQTYKEGAYEAISRPWTPELDAQLVKKHGDNLLEVVNRQFQETPPKKSRKVVKK